MNIIEKIKKLNLPRDQYVIVSGSVLDVLGIRKASDIDIVVTKKLFDEMRGTGEWQEVEKYNRIFLNREGFDIIPQLNWEKYTTTAEEAISSAFVIEGIPFMNLDELIKFKTALGREKDFKDIELIKNYQKGL